MEPIIFMTELHGLWRKISLEMFHTMSRVFAPLTPSQARLLLQLNHFGKMKVSELGTHMQMPLSNISMICKRLEKQGLVRRIRDEKDLRTVYIQPTEEALALTNHLKSRLEEQNREIGERATPEEQRAILEGLKIMHRLYRQ